MLRKTILLQKRAIRYIHKASYNSHTEPLFNQIQYLKLRDLYEYETLLFMHGFANGNLPSSFDNVFKYSRDVLAGHRRSQLNIRQIDRCYSKFSKYLKYGKYGVNKLNKMF